MHRVEISARGIGKQTHGYRSCEATATTTRRDAVHPAVLHEYSVEYRNNYPHGAQSSVKRNFMARPTGVTFRGRSPIKWFFNSCEATVASLLSIKKDAKECIQIQIPPQGGICSYRVLPSSKDAHLIHHLLRKWSPFPFRGRLDTAKFVPLSLCIAPPIIPLHKKCAASICGAFLSKFLRVPRELLTRSSLGRVQGQRPCRLLSP